MTEDEIIKINRYLAKINLYARRIRSSIATIRNTDFDLIQNILYDQICRDQQRIRNATKKISKIVLNKKPARVAHHMAI